MTRKGLHDALQVSWMEFEEGWGAKPAGSTLYKNLEDAVRCLELYRTDHQQFSECATSGSYPSTRPLPVLVPQKLYNKLVWGKHGRYGFRVSEDDAVYRKIKFSNTDW